MIIEKISKSQKMLSCFVKVLEALFSTQKTATKCVIDEKIFKSQKMLSGFVKVLEALFPTQKTASKCVITAVKESGQRS